MAQPAAPEIDPAPNTRTELGWIDWLRQRAQPTASTEPAASPESLAPSAAAPAQPETLVLGIGDDCAILRPRPGEDLVLTTDFTLEGRHFRRDWHGPESAGHRTLARGLSDLAAMGARPVAAFLSLAIPPADARSPAWTERFLQSFLALAGRFGVPLAGGDTSAAPSEHLLADVVLLGAVPRGTALRRAGARAGDQLFVTGSLGGAAAELKKLAAAASSPEPTGNHPQLFPEPRLAIGEMLRSERLATACIDLSDGLSTDLAHLCAASHLTARVNWHQLPLSPLAKDLPASDQLQAVLHGGEDYELLFTAAPDTRVPAQIHGTPVTRIGSLHAPETPPAEPASPAVLLRRNGQEHPLLRGGWEHLK